MVTYKYIKDFYIYDSKEEEFCREHSIVFFKPSKERDMYLKEWLKFFVPPDIDCKDDITCFWRSFGVWGMYHPEDNAISICPLNIENAPGGLKGVIEHEILHLKHPEADMLDQEGKEKLINKFADKKK